MKFDNFADILQLETSTVNCEPYVVIFNKII